MVKRVSDYENYIRSGVWKCGKSPTGAHHWIEVSRSEALGLFLCKYCLDAKKFPISFTWPDSSSVSLGKEVD